MVTPRATRPGHSLPELIVATTFLATTLVAVGGTALLGARWTARAAELQAAVRAAEAVLDSLAADPGAGPGETEDRGLRIRWTVTARAIRVEVRSGTRAEGVVALEGPRLPTVPTLPDTGADSLARPARASL